MQTASRCRQSRVPEKPQLTVLGESGSFRARTHRLQQKLSESLRREMHRDTGGVLAAMTVGDRSGLSAQLRSAYRGAGLSHVLVVSGMHVSILCGDILSVLLPYRWEQSYRRRRRRTVWKSLLALVTDGCDWLYTLGAPRRRGGVGQRLGCVGMGPGGYSHLAGGGRHPDDRRQQLCGVGYRF